MGYLGIAICLFGLIMSILIDRKTKILSPAVMFFALWTMILVLSSLNLFGVLKPSEESLGLIAMMCLFFFLGSVACHFKSKKNHNSGQKMKLSYTNWTIIYILYAVSIIIGLIDVYLVYKYSKSGIPLWKVRNWTLEPYGSSNPILDRRSFLEELFRTIVITPFNQIFTPLSSFYLFNEKNKKIKKRLLVLLIIKTLVNSISGGGGRLGVIYLAICLITSYLLLKNRAQSRIAKNTAKNALSLVGKYKKYVLLATFLGFVAMVVATNLRTGTGNLFRQFYTYFAMPPTLLSVWLPSVKELPKTIGLSSLFGVHTYIFRGLEQIGIPTPEVYQQAFQNILNAEIFRDAGFGIANAFVTPVYYFMCDGGQLFVIIASMILGYVVMNPYKKLIVNDSDVRSYLIYALVMIGVFSSFMRIQTVAPAYVLSFVFIPIVTKRKAAKDEK